MSMLVDGQQTLVTDNRPTLLVLNKKDLIKPGEIAKKKEVPHLRYCLCSEIRVVSLVLLWIGIYVTIPHFYANFV